MIDLVQFCTRLSAACGSDQLRAVRLFPDEIAVYLLPEVLPQVVHTLRHEFDAAFVDLFGLDARSSQDIFQLYLIFALDSEHTWVHLNIDIDERAPVFPSLVDGLPATGWYEREVWEELGVLPNTI
jgi:Ni,Fe-hydrogenase III component G